MRPYLTFLAAAPLGAFGEVAPNERRGSAPRPTRSGVLGLVAAALGIERDDQATLAALTAGYGVATALLPGATPLLDYHTVQSPRQPDLNAFAKRHGRPPATRREALAAGETATLLSRRDHWCDVAFVAALWARANAPFPLERLAEALERPRFVLYLGRKACPLALPLRPRVVEATDAVAALRAVTLPDGVALWRGAFVDGVPSIGEVGLDPDPDEPAAEWPDARVVERRDLPRHHRSWLFDPRRERVVAVPRPSRAEPS